MVCLRGAVAPHPKQVNWLLVRPVQQLVERPGRDDALGRDAVSLRSCCAVVEKAEVPWGVGVAVDAEQAPRVFRQLDERTGWIAALRPGIDLDRDVVRGAGGEDGLGVELWGALVPRAPSTRRPVQWPRMLVCGFSTAPIIRLVIWCDSMASLEWALATTMSSRSSSEST